jgi:hypothetical protein
VTVCWDYAQMPVAVVRVVETPERDAVRAVVQAARDRGDDLTGPDGLLRQLTKTVLVTALDEETSEHARTTVYLVVRSLNPRAPARHNGSTRWKPALHAFAVTFADRMPNPEEPIAMKTAVYTENRADPAAVTNGRDRLPGPKFFNRTRSSVWLALTIRTPDWAADSETKNSSSVSWSNRARVAAEAVWVPSCPWPCTTITP